jgi:AraC family transcriptional regulator of arabinose operon
MARPLHAPTWIGFKRSSRRQPNRVNRPFGEGVWLMEYTVTGKATVYDPTGKELTFSRGDLFCYQSHTPQHYQLKKGEASWHHYWVDFVPPDHWLPWLNWTEHFPGFRSRSITDPKLRKRIEWLLQQGLEANKTQYSHRYVLTMNIVEQILLWAEMESPRNSHTAMDARIRSILKQIDSMLAAPIQLKDLAEKAGLSVSRFGHLFQQTIGISPMRYLEQRRLERATELLRSTNEPVAQIARRVGYEDPLYFSKVVHRTTGLSPIQYRRDITRKGSRQIPNNRR